MQHDEVTREGCLRKSDLSHKLNTQKDKEDGWSDLIPRPKNLLTFIWLRPLKELWRASLPSLFWGRGMLLHQRYNPGCFFTKNTLLPCMRTQQTCVFNCRDQKVMHDLKYPKSSHHSFKMWPRWKTPSDILSQYMQDVSKSQSLNVPLRIKYHIY